MHMYRRGHERNTERKGLGVERRRARRTDLMRKEGGMMLMLMMEGAVAHDGDREAHRGHM